MPTGDRPTPPTRFCKLTYELTFASVTFNNVMWLYLTGSGTITVSELNALAAACSSKYANRFLPLMRTGIQLNRTQVVLYDAGDALEGVAGPGGSGSHSSGIFLPANVAACISWQIAPVYRGGHARTYLCGLSSDQLLDEASFSSSFVSSLNSAANAFHADLEAISGISSGISTVEHGIASFVRNKAWRTPPVFYRISAASVDNRVDTQRRRLGRDR